MSCGTPLSRLDRWSIRRRAAWDRCLSAVSGHSSFVIDYSAKHIIFVYGDGTSKTFAGSNPLHLERFLSGAGYKRDSAARSLASTSRLELPTALCQDIPFTPLSMDERLAALELSLRAHSFLCDSLSVSTHSLGEAIRLCAPRLCDGYMSSLRAIAHNANLARHHDLLALPRDEQTRYLKLLLRHTFGAWSGVIGAKLRMWNAYDRGYERALQAWAVSEVKSILHYCFGILRDEASEARKQQDIKAAQDRLRDSHISKYDQALTALASCRCKSLLHFCFGAWKETSHKRILKAHKKKVRELNDEVRALQEQVVKLTSAERMLKLSHDAELREQRVRSEMAAEMEAASRRMGERSQEFARMQAEANLRAEISELKRQMKSGRMVNEQLDEDPLRLDDAPDRELLASGFQEIIAGFEEMAARAAADREAHPTRQEAKARNKALRESVHGRPD